MWNARIVAEVGLELGLLVFSLFLANNFPKKKKGYSLLLFRARANAGAGLHARAELDTFRGGGPFGRFRKARGWMSRVAQLPEQPGALGLTGASAFVKVCLLRPCETSPAFGKGGW